jgi:hypothetical protein
MSEQRSAKNDTAKSIVEYFSKGIPEHEDTSKCGLCLKEKIKSEVANEYLKAGRLQAEDLPEMFEEIEKRWKETDLFKRVRLMLDTGKSLKEIEEELSKEGIEI